MNTTVIDNRDYEAYLKKALKDKSTYTSEDIQKLTEKYLHEKGIK